MELTVRNANDLFSEGLWKLKTCGVKSDSRNGAVIRIEEPVIITVERPQERVLFFEGRDAAHIFHLMECLWICSGRRDVGFLKNFNRNIGQFSDNGELFNAAYGYRMRYHFGRDQLLEVIQTLKEDSNSRQAVIQLWDSEDLRKKTLDKCCNTQLVFDIVRDRVNLTVFNRSNDFWWGNAGSNIVHFSFLLEVVALAVGKPLGRLRTMINNLHIYDKSVYDASKYLENPPSSADYDMYLQGVKPYPIMREGEGIHTWLEHATRFCTNPFTYDRTLYPFFREVAYPMAMVSHARKNGETGLKWAKAVAAEDWRIAVTDWIERREEAKKRK